MNTHNKISQKTEFCRDLENMQNCLIIFQIDRIVPVAGKEQMTEFSHLFSERTSKSLSDGHLWFSVFARPPQSRFTRLQRVSCCLCLLFVSMLANAMFTGQESEGATNALELGPFSLSLKQVCKVIFIKESKSKC